MEIAAAGLARRPPESEGREDDRAEYAAEAAGRRRRCSPSQVMGIGEAGWMDRRRRKASSRRQRGPICQAAASPFCFFFFFPYHSLKNTLARGVVRIIAKINLIKF